jgi:hypothetical protein
MRRAFLAGFVFVAGCQGWVLPFQRPPGPIDNPCLTVAEQQQRARDRLALPQDSPTVGPRTDADQPYGIGR